MKKILALAVALVMVMALAVSVSAETLFEYSSPVPIEFGWTNLVAAGSSEAAAFFEAIKADGAVIEMIATDLKEGDRQAEVVDAWFQICTQDTVNWTEEGGLKTENIGETYAFTDEGYTITIPGAAFNKLVEDSGVDPSNLTLILNAGGSWATTSSHITIRVSVGDTAAAAPAETEAEAPAAEAEAPAASTETAAPSTGIALAVIPAVVAMAAVAVSKKH